MRDLFDDRRECETRRHRRVDVENCARHRRRDQGNRMGKPENRIERQNDPVVIVQGQPVMSGGRRVDVMRLAMAVNQELVQPVFLCLVYMLHRRQREHRDAVHQHDRDHPTGSHATPC